ncbi:hypothetical protein [uncultured Parabacteroides sp.]|uniref:hypothetical protein n=1 Tax=uncultured Parabacteroides sp. TaxID=512312 RepID=UPI00258D0E80|nr:hypothetical protein [uncultured Parabacteroides sp.]
MKTRKLQWLLAAMMFAMVVSILGGCSKDDDPSDPDNKLPDPEGTVSVNISESYDEYGRPSYVDIGGVSIRWVTPDNIVTSYGSELIVNVGQMKGLANIIKVPESGWSKNVSCEPGCGYIAREAYRDENNELVFEYSRFYVVRSITDVSGGIIGAEIKYQKDWVPGQE